MENCTLILYLNLFEWLYLVTFQEELTTSNAALANTLEFVALTSDTEPGNAVTVRYSFKNAWFVENFLYSLRHLGLLHIVYACSGSRYTLLRTVCPSVIAGSQKLL